MSNTQLITTHDIISTLDDLLKVAAILVKSGMLPKEVKSPEGAAAIILKGREVGMPIMESFSLINIIGGKPTVAPQGMLALIYRSQELENMTIEDDGQTCTVTMKRKGKEPHSESFSMADADLMTTSEWVDNVKRTVPLSQKSNWKQMPKVMRKWRAISACARIVFPDIIGGMYTPEEVGAEVDEEGVVISDAVELAIRAGQQEADFDQRPEQEKAKESTTMVKAAQEMGGVVVPPEGTDTYSDYIEGVLAYRKWKSGKVALMVFNEWHVAQEQVGKSLKSNQIEHLMTLFSGRPEFVNHLKKHFKKASGAALTWEELAALIEWKEHGKPDPRWYGDKIAEKKEDDIRAKEIVAGYGITDQTQDDAKAFIEDMLTVENHQCLVPIMSQYNLNWQKDHEALRSLAAILAQHVLTVDSKEFIDMCDQRFLPF